MIKEKKVQSSHHIMKNTLTLYVRMFFVIIVNLFTSRVILEVLGVDDYGIYNVVGGIVVLFTFLNTTMSSSTSRFITFELGRKDLIEVNKVFNTALTIHIVIALIILLIAETIGLWFLENRLNISEDRMFAARIVYQLSILVCMVSVIQVPYQASIIANEKMDIYVAPRGQHTGSICSKSREKSREKGIGKNGENRREKAGNYDCDREGGESRKAGDRQQTGENGRADGGQAGESRKIRSGRGSKSRGKIPRSRRSGKEAGYKAGNQVGSKIRGKTRDKNEKKHRHE